MQNRIRPAVPYVALLGIVVLLYAAAAQIDGAGGAAGRLGPDFWPKLIIGLMAVLCLYEIVKRLFIGSAFEASGVLDMINKASADAAPTDATAVQDAAGAAGETPEPRHRGMLLGGLAVTTAYVLLAPVLGFFLATALFLFSFSVIGGFRRWGIAAAVAGLGSFVLFTIFMRVAYVSLPLGEGPFQYLSLLLLRLLGAA